ncbi:MAG: hypothetical protein AB7T06_10480 [Kofleriaceae bacterium]
MRPYGTVAEDLEVDFTSARAVVVTELLARCLEREAEELWDLPISKRSLLLVAVSEQTAPPIEVHLSCACGEASELTLTSAELAEFAAERAKDPRVGELRLRVPTGRDQLRWTALAAENDETLKERVLLDLVVDAPAAIDPAMLPLIDKALGEIDPLVELRVDSTCSACGAPVSIGVDLEAIAISRMRKIQRDFVEDVHHLARAYHWSEADIARMPVWRRSEYLALLGKARA